MVVEILSGARAGRRHEFDDPTVLRFGRHPDNDVPFDPQADIDASSRHAELRRESGTFVLCDLGSANGTRIEVEGQAGGSRLLGPTGPAQPCASVASGAVVEFGAGGPRCRLLLGAAPVAAAPAPAIASTRYGGYRRRATSSESSGGRVGQSTVARMISDALAEARGKQGALRSTTFMRSLAHAAVVRSTRTFKLVAGGLAVALVVVSVGLVVTLRRAGRGEEAIRRDLLRAMEEQRASDGAAIRQKLGELNAELSRARAAHGGRAIARAAREGVYLVAVRGTDGREEGFCTAFAVAPHDLATNAHCVELGTDLRKRGGRIFVVRNGDGRTRLEVTRMRRSPGYVPGGARISTDVGLLHVDEQLPMVVPLAPREALLALQPGDVIFTYGFPGRLADASAPEATFVEGVIGRITRLDGETGSPDDAVLIQHSAFTAGGTSGSPIFDGEGRAVAVNAGGYLEDGELKVRDPRSGRPSSLVVAQPLPGYNFGMRIDLVASLLKEGDE